VIKIPFYSHKKNITSLFRTYIVYRWPCTLCFKTNLS